MTRRLVRLLFSLVLTFPAFAGSAPPLAGTGGAVATDDRYATRTALELLATGGNAVDAAVGAALVMAVTYPEAGNLGGGGFAVVRFEGKLYSLDFREVAPAAASRTMFLDEKGEPRPKASTVGPLATGVPGSPVGIWELHRRFGKLPWKDVVAPAQKLATDGFEVGQYFHKAMSDPKVFDRLRSFAETVKQWLPDGGVPKVGTLMRQPDLAKTLAAYAELGPKGLTEGEPARAIEEISAKYGGVLKATDLAAYQPEWREPLTFSGLGWEFAGMGLPSSGSTLMAESVWMLERLEWAKLPRFGAARAHLLAEVWRRAFADRSLMGEPNSSFVSPTVLLSQAHLERHLKSLDPAKATPSSELEPKPPLSDDPLGDTPASEKGTETTHLSVIDEKGNAVALTTTLNELYGCGLWVPGAGFFLNNEMDDFATAPGKPNAWGFLQSTANEVAPGRRMLSSMSPTLAWKGDETLAIGARGGAMIPNHVLQALLNLILDGDSLSEALARPRLHHQWFPDQLRAEPDTLAPETRAELERRGHTIEINTYAAKVNAVRRLKDGTFEAAGEPRNGATAGVVVAWPR